MSPRAPIAAPSGRGSRGVPVVIRKSRTFTVLLLAYNRTEVRNKPSGQLVLDEVTRIYGRFTKAQLGMPAHHTGLSAENITGITWDGKAGDFPVMRFDKDCFNRALPKTAVQFISMPCEEKTGA